MTFLGVKHLECEKHKAWLGSCQNRKSSANENNSAYDDLGLECRFLGQPFEHHSSREMNRFDD